MRGSRVVSYGNVDSDGEMMIDRSYARVLRGSVAAGDQFFNILADLVVFSHALSCKRTAMRFGNFALPSTRNVIDAFATW